MAFKNFKVETDADGIALVTWDIPGRSMNVLDETSTSELDEIIKQTTADAAVKGVVITSSKDAFCAGADLVALSRGESLAPSDPDQLAWGFAGMVSHPISKPIIAAVNGFAFGGGCEIALMSDIIVAADHAQFGLPEVKVGLFAAAGGAFRLAQQIPQPRGPTAGRRAARRVDPQALDGPRDQLAVPAAADQHRDPPPPVGVGHEQQVAVPESEDEVPSLRFPGAHDGVACPPCGSCRQILHEMGPDLVVITEAEDGAPVRTPLSTLLPFAFGGDRLG